MGVGTASAPRPAAEALPPVWLATLTVTATYVYFLIYAQFGFLQAVQEMAQQQAAAGGADAVATVRGVMAAMGIAGFGGSGLAGWLCGRPDRPAHWWVGVGLASAAVTAVGSLWVSSPVGFLLVAVATGLATALLTVAVATALAELDRSTVIWAAGVGTGLAYLICNFPPLFVAPPSVRALFAAGACLVTLATLAAGWLASRRSWRSSGPARTEEPMAAEGAGMRGLFAGVASFLALIWLDSAAFAVIQQTPALALATWGSPARIAALGLVHLVAALVAWRLLASGRLALIPWLTWGLFALGGGLLAKIADVGTGAATSGLAGAIYAAGISLYSAALVAWPALTADRRVAARWRAAAVFGVAGWLGSALGVGMAQDLGFLPRWPIFVALAILVLTTVFGRTTSWRGTGGGPGRLGDASAASSGPGSDTSAGPRSASLRSSSRVLALGPTVLFGLLLVAGQEAVDRGEEKLDLELRDRSNVVSSDPDATLAAVGSATAVARGRAVYVAEGCVNCHSQFVRPDGADPLLVGPSRPLDRSATPLLIGNRRQGPDLAMVGNRRSARWHRLHLIAPRDLVPGSRMPSYAHLFAPVARSHSGQTVTGAGGAGPGASRGEDLVAYLSSLGSDSLEQRAEDVAKAAFTSSANTRSPVEAAGERGRLAGARLFAAYCAACHGSLGRGDGALAVSFGQRSLDLGKGRFWLLPGAPVADATSPWLRAQLATVVRFGIIGTDMPGHEWLTARQVTDLAEFVANLADPGPASSPAASLDGRSHG